VRSNSVFIAFDPVIDALPGGRVRGPDAWWVQNLNVANSRQAWLVIDPPDGHIPRVAAQGAAAPDGDGRGHAGDQRP
jgi:hypothetical protein